MYAQKKNFVKDEYFGYWVRLGQSLFWFYSTLCFHGRCRRFMNFDDNINELCNQKVFDSNFFHSMWAISNWNVKRKKIKWISLHAIKEQSFQGIYGNAWWSFIISKEVEWYSYWISSTCTIYVHWTPFGIPIRFTGNWKDWVYYSIQGAAG